MYIKEPLHPKSIHLIRIYDEEKTQSVGKQRNNWPTFVQCNDLLSSLDQANSKEQTHK